MGRIQKYYKEVCLLDQAWVKDGDKSISKFLEEKSKEVGSPITVTRYARFERGEGIEKVEKTSLQKLLRLWVCNIERTLLCSLFLRKRVHIYHKEGLQWQISHIKE